MKAVVITVSDSSSRGEREDVSGPRVKAHLEAAGFTVAPILVVPDEAVIVSQRLRDFAGGGQCDVIFTTGGTGVAQRDITPEATRQVIDKEIPGFGELMRAEGLKHTTLAPLSRATAGTLGRTLIVNLPGSPKGAVESLDAILGLVPHVHKLLCGETGH
jgi:molybdopterin adenylyltransferase